MRKNTVRTCILILVCVLSTAYLVHLFTRDNTHTFSSILNTTFNQENTKPSLHSWSLSEKKDMLSKLTDYFTRINVVPKSSSEKIASCVLNELINKQYNYHRILEILRRTEQGGEMGKEMWYMVSSCMSKVLNIRQQTINNIKRIPALLVPSKTV